MFCWSIHVPSIAILSPLNLDIKPIPSHDSPHLSSLALSHFFLLFSTTWCVYGPSIHCRFSTFSFPLFHTRGRDITQFPTSPMNIPRPIMPCILLHPSYLFSRFLSSIYHSSSASVSHPSAFYKLILLFLFSRHISLRFFIPSLLNPVLHLFFSRFKRSCPGAHHSFCL